MVKRCFVEGVGDEIRGFVCCELWYWGKNKETDLQSYPQAGHLSKGDTKKGDPMKVKL